MKKPISFWSWLSLRLHFPRVGRKLKRRGQKRKRPLILEPLQPRVMLAADVVASNPVEIEFGEDGNSTESVQDKSSRAEAVSSKDLVAARLSGSAVKSIEDMFESALDLISEEQVAAFETRPVNGEITIDVEHHASTHNESSRRVT